MANSKSNIELNLIFKSDRFKTEADKTKEKLDKIKRAAYSANLSLLFAGAAMQRMSQQVMTFGTRAYDEISHSIVGTVTASDRLNGSMTMLGFSVGEALQPLIEFLIPIVEYINDWVEENPKLTAGIIGIVAALGTLIALNSSINLITSSLGALRGGLTGLGSTIMIGVALYMAANAYDELKKGDILAGAADALVSAGFLAGVMGKGGVGAALVGIGVALDIVDTIVDKKKLTKSSLAQWLITAGGGAFLVNPAIGAALVTIGVALELMNENTWVKFYSALGIAFGAIIYSIAGVLDLIMVPIIAIVNQLLGIWNLINGRSFGHGAIKQWNLTSAAGARIEELKNQYNEANNTVSNIVNIGTVNVSGDNSLKNYLDSRGGQGTSSINPYFGR